MKDRLHIYQEIGGRSEQQDSCLGLTSSTETALIVVSDGVGGKSGGQAASRIVSQQACNLWEEAGGRFADPRDSLLGLCRSAHHHIREWGISRNVSAAATIVALYLTDREAHWVHVGDSRLYHFRGGRFFQRTEDHSLVQILVKKGEVLESEMGSHPDQGVLLRSLGSEDLPEVDYDRCKVGAHDAFLLCTDGFWETTSVDYMADLLAMPHSVADERIRTAVRTAVEKNGRRSDNVSVGLALSQREYPSIRGRSLQSILFLAAIYMLGCTVIGAAIWYFQHGRNSALPASSRILPPRNRDLPIPSLLQAKASRSPTGISVSRDHE